MAFLEKSFADTLTEEARLQLASLFLEGDVTDDPASRRLFPAYLSYCEFLKRQQVVQEIWLGELKYKMLVTAFKQIHIEGNAKPPKLRQILADKRYQLVAKQYDAIIVSALRYSLMIDLQTPGSISALQLDDNISFNGMINSILPRTTYPLSRNDSRIPFNFTVASMVNVCKLEIKWTHTLHDHLRLSRSRQKDRNIRTLHIFIHIPALNMMLENNTSLFPTKVLAEVIGTTQLLFPRNDEETKEYIGSLSQPEATDLYRNLYTDGVGDEEILNFAKLEYFREQILELKEVVFDDPPFTWKRFFLGLRNPEKLLNFWIALVFIFVLTLVSTITGILQTIKAFHPVK